MGFRIVQPTAFLSVLMILALLCSGCITSRENSGSPQGEGITDITPRDEQERIPLSGALAALEGSDLARVQDSPPIHIHYIRGESVDGNGTSQGWIIGVLKGNKPFYFVYTGSGQQIMDCNNDLPSQEIIPEKILSPDALFRQRPLLIQDLTDGGRREIDSLEVRDGSYIMTSLSEGKVRVFYFDMISGIEMKQE